MSSIFSNIAVISKTADIEKELSLLCGGEIIRFAIIDLTDNDYVVSFSYKK